MANSFSKGLQKDLPFIKHSEETTTFVLNGIYDSFDGEMTSIQNEPGNTPCWSVPNGYIIIGHINISRDEIIVFSVNPETGKSQIGSVHACNYTTLIDSSCLGFNECKQIKGEFRKIGGCDRNIYFYDCFNTDKAINLDDLEKYTLKNTEGTHVSVEEANEKDLWDCNEMLIEPELQSPCVCEIQVQDDGGFISPGSWRFAIEILDSDLNSVGFSQVSNPVNVYDELINGDWSEIDGAFPLPQYQASQGAKETTKSIDLTLCNLDTSFTFARVHAIRAVDDIVIEVFEISDLVNISEETEQFTFTGITDEDIRSDISKITTPRIKYDFSCAMEIVNKRLIRANLGKSLKDWSEFQRSASKITSNYVVQEAETNNQNDPGNPKNPHDFMTFMGDEVYAFGIVYEFANGEFSPAFHIPGRPKDTCYRSELVEDTLTCVYLESGFPGIDPDCPPLEYSARIRVNGVPQDYDGVIGADEKIELFCADSPDDEVTIDYVLSIQSDVGLDCGDNEVYGVLKYKKTSTGTTIEGCMDCNQDSQIIEEWNPDLSYLYTEEEYNNLPDDEKLEKWQVYNTAFPYQGTNKGDMSYYECSNAVYPDIRDCNGDSIWGVDACGNELVGQPIRHHKFPDRVIETQYDDSTRNIRRLGVEFSNIEYPHPDIIKHHFVKVKRDQFNRTIIDKGVLGQMRTSDEAAVFCYLNTNNDDENSNYNYFHSPKNMIDGNGLSGTHFKLENVWRRESKFEKQEKYNGGVFSDDDFVIMTRSLNYGHNVTPNPETNVKIESSAMLSPLSYQDMQGLTVYNLSQFNKKNVFYTDRILAGSPAHVVRHASLKVNRDVYCNLFNLEYYRMHSCGLKLSDSQVIYGGDSYITEFAISDGVLVEVNSGIWSSAFAVLAVIAATALTVVSLGAAGVPAAIITSAIILGALGTSIATAQAIIEWTADGRFKAFLENHEGDFDPEGQGGTGYIAYGTEHLRGVWIESEYNLSLRHGGTGECDTYFNGGSIEQQHNYFKNKMTYYSESDGELALKPLPCPEVYHYNKSYSRIPCENVYLPLPITHDYCDECDREENVMIWSQRGFQEETADAMRIFLPLDRTQVGSHAGPITNVKFDRNAMTVLTANSAFTFAPNPRQLQTDAEQVYTGVGDFLAIPEQELSKIDWGYAGNQGRFNAINTPYGWTYVDQASGEVFNLRDGLDKISDIGMRHWFRENLPSKLEETLKNYGIKYDCTDNTSSFKGIGLISAYDPRYKRYILHKTDFLPIRFMGKYEDRGDFGGLYYNTETKEWIFIGELGEEIVQFGDPRYFCNKSWTISFSYLYNAWTSFHSYQPSYMLNDHDKLFTVNFDNVAHKHGPRNFTNFYGDNYDFIVEYPINDLPTTQLHALHWYARIKEWDGINEYWIDVDDVTFNKLVAYNSSQSTGNQELQFLNKQENPYLNSGSWNNTTKQVIVTKKDSKVSQLRDMSSGQPVMTSDCNYEDYKQEFNKSNSNRQGFIDKVPYDVNINYNKSRYELNDLQDKYHIVRLFFNNERDLKIVLDIANSRTFKTIH